MTSKNAFWLKGLLVAGILSLPMAAQAAPIYMEDFEGAGAVGSEWSSSALPGGLTRELYPDAGASGGLGLGESHLGTPRSGSDPDMFTGSDELTLTLNDAALNNSIVTLSFDLILTRSWDGVFVDTVEEFEAIFGDGSAYGPTFPYTNQDQDPDRFLVSVEGGDTLLDTTFANRLLGSDIQVVETQNYPNPTGGDLVAAGTGAAAINELGYALTYYNPFSQAFEVTESIDSLYRLSFTFPWMSNILEIDWQSLAVKSLGAGLGQGEATAFDEAWALDNVLVEAVAVPEPGTYLMLGTSLLLVSGLRRRKLARVVIKR
jgi:hypothetical protein